MLRRAHDDQVYVLGIDERRFRRIPQALTGEREQQQNANDLGRTETRGGAGPCHWESIIAEISALTLSCKVEPDHFVSQSGKGSQTGAVSVIGTLKSLQKSVRCGKLGTVRRPARQATRSPG